MYKFRFEEYTQVEVTPGVYDWIWETMKVSPIYGEDAKLSVEREQDEMFCRYDFSGTFTFTGKDFEQFLNKGGYNLKLDLGEYVNRDYNGKYVIDKYGSEEVLRMDGKGTPKMFVYDREGGYYQLFELVGDVLEPLGAEDFKVYIYVSSLDQLPKSQEVLIEDLGQPDRPELAGYLTFATQAKGLSEKYSLKVDWEENGRSTEIISANFTIADMEFDLDNKIAKLSVKGKDQYEDFLNKYDAEYDLVQLAPPRKSVDLVKRGFLQLYVFGDTKVTNILGNFEYEGNASGDAPDKTYQDILDMGFTKLTEYNSINITTEPRWGLERYDGKYYGDRSENVLWREDREYKIIPANWESGGWWKIVPAVGEDPDIKGLGFAFVWTAPSYQGNLEYRPLQGTYKYGGVSDISTRDIYGRIIHDNPSKENIPITEADIWQKNLNYRYIKAFTEEEATTYRDRIVLSEETTKIPNKWQSDGKGNYFVQPKSTDPSERVIAIGWNQWIPMSIWFRNSVGISDMLEPYDQNWTLRDAYSIKDSIRVLLDKISPSMEIDSNFLDNVGYGSDFNPILGRGQQLWLYLTPITNVKRTYYNQAAQRGKITLKQILEMLKTCFDCYWCLKDNGGRKTLKIEHREWFKNGGDYGRKIIYDDLQGKIVNLSKKGWLTDEDKTNFDLSEIKSRVAYKWGDKSSEIFNGYPVLSSDNFAKDKEVDKKEVSNFVADIDIIESSPESLSDDVFVVIGASENGSVSMKYVGKYENGNLSYNYPVYLLQNGMLSFYFLEQKFLNYDLSTDDMDSMRLEGLLDQNGNDAPLDVFGKKWIVRQKVSLPYAITTPNLCEQLFLTGCKMAGGEAGAIRSIETNVHTLASEIELEFPLGY